MELQTVKDKFIRVHIIITHYQLKVEDGTGQEEWVLQSPLHVAAYSGDIAQLEQLLQSGMLVSFNELSRHDNIHACDLNNEFILSYVVEVDSVEENGRTALMYCAMAEQVDCLQLLLKRGSFVSAQDNNGQTALHWAAVTVSSNPDYCVTVIILKLYRGVTSV